MRSLLVKLLLCGMAGSLPGQTSSFLHTIRQDSAFDLIITMDWKTLIRRKKEKEYQPAKITCIKPGQDTMFLESRVRTRGHMRLEICSFPPIKIKFNKDELARYHLAELNEADLVHHCDDSKLHDQLILREYLAYKLFELVSPHYFKTQLVRLHYLDPESAEAFKPTFAFLVENEEELLDRLHGRKVKINIIGDSALDKESFLRTCLFQFMIGNTDWFIPSSHNLEFIGVPERRMLQTIPYDFDYSGLVSAPYSTHHPSIELPSVSIRYYQGHCHSEEEVRQQLQVFLDQKANILKMPYQIQGLDEKSILHTTSYLQSFFDIIENPKKLQNQVLKHCDMWPVKK